ncbi:Atxe2 family lasso peptide isopeptidase [Sphingobium sp. HWE2-09]|uniref:Atxe2 family lasso peptide isopeptidase n=1 Tax=Sphingobium sp. HWE2-09 TaxID=3108390 RepID=UPI002DC36BDA|nr:Atxe2 family lasso peptide isopeptidase [Sphingobium sp. HWE2-09]
MLISLVISLAGAGAVAVPAAPAIQDCATLLSPRMSAARRPIEDRDLIELLDIGPISQMEAGPFYAVSPDHTMIAVSLRRANIAHDDYCTGIVLVNESGEATVLDAGPGAAFFRLDEFYGTNGFPTGVTKLITPRWSADGQRLAYLKFEDGRLRLRVWEKIGRDIRSVKNDAGNIVDFQFTPGGDSLVYKIWDETRQQATLQTESKRGYRFDDRYFPFASSIPFPSGAPLYRYETVDLIDGRVRTASDAEEALVSTARRDDSSFQRVRAVTVADEPGVERIAANIQGKEERCESPLCSRTDGRPWLSLKGKIRFVRRDAWAGSAMSIYEWAIGTKAPHRLYSTPDLLLNCGPIGEDVLCGRESSMQPRRLDRIDLTTQKSSTVFDPNPAFANLIIGRAERLKWKNDQGVECFGDLVYPPDFRPGHRYPLIVVQYESRGFLRGGTGDEYPIQLFAREGYLVLSMQRPRSPLFGKGLSSMERQRLQNEGFLERRGILSAIETKVRQLIDMGLADPDRIGITGLSDGSTTVQYAASHSDLFSAAAISGCCWEPSQTWLLGPSLQTAYERVGWPRSPEEQAAKWGEISLARNASHIAFPLLVQAADGEYLVALEAVRALREAGSPVDLFVYPDELHIKRHPAHRASVYHRNLLWFDFWLRGKKPPADDPGAAEVDRWALMQQKWKNSKARALIPRQPGGG